MKLNWLFCVIVVASVSIEPSLSACEITDNADFCNYTVTCTGIPDAIRTPNNCDAIHSVTLIITKSAPLILSKGFFGSTNFDTRVRNFSASDNVWNTIASSAFRYFSNCIQMDLSNNQITTMENQAFDNLLLMNFLNLSRNSIEKLLPNTFLIQSNNIKVLDLSYNELTTLSSELDDLLNLSALYLQNNKLESISDDSFQVLDQLNYLYLQHNRLKTLHVTLDNLKNLITLDVSDNYLVILSGFELNSLGSINILHVKNLNLNNNKMRGDITGNTFSRLRHIITTMDFTNQNITGIKNKAFADMESLLKLNLSKNSIEAVDNTSFFNTSITILDLSYNKLKDLSFLKNSLTNLTEFFVSNNNIQVISKITFENQQHIMILDLSKNNIIRIEETSLPLLKLQYLNLAGNQLTGKIDRNVYSPAKFLRFLDLSNSHITSIDETAFVDLPVLEKLKLSHNQIENIGSNNFNGLNNMHSLDLSHNKLTNLRIINTTLTNLGALYLNNNNLRDISETEPLLYLDVSQNELPNLTTLNLAHNKIKNFNNQKINTLSSLLDLKLSSNELTTIQLSFFKDLESADLSYNNLTYINRTFLQNIENLESLDMSCNKITVIQPGTFQLMKDLNFLNLSANFLTNLRYGSLKGLNNIEVMDISTNSIAAIDADLFHECNELNTLIIDYNRIKSLDLDRLLLVAPKLRTISLGGNLIDCKEILLNVKLANSSTSTRRVEVTSVDKIYHEDNVHGIKCGDDDSNVNTNEPEVNSDTSSSMVSIVWCSALTIAFISIGAAVIYKRYRKNRYQSFPIDMISRSSLELD